MLDRKRHQPLVMKILFPKKRSKRQILIVAATMLQGIIFVALIRKAKVVTASPLLDSEVEHEGRRTTWPTTERTRAEETSRCQRRVDSLDWPGAGKRCSGGWAVSQHCGHPLDTLFFVHSAPKNWQRRVDLRATLLEEAAGAAFNWTGVFFIGEDKDATVNLWTRLEADVFGDVVILHYNDTFLNLPYKFVAGMRWVTEHCPNVSTIVKIDDDVSVQPFELRRYLDEELPQKNNAIHCNIVSTMPVLRHPHARYCIPEIELPQDWYPRYCSGCSMIMTIDTMRKLFRASQISKGYAIEDAYVSGHLALIANIGHISINSKVGLDVWDSAECMLEGKVIFTHEISAYGKSVDRRVQWGLMLWMHMMQASPRYTFRFSHRLSDKLYRRDFWRTRRALQEGL